MEFFKWAEYESGVSSTRTYSKGSKLVSRVCCGQCYRHKPIVEYIENKSDHGTLIRRGRPIKGLIARAFENHLLTSYQRESYPSGEIIANDIERKRKIRIRKESAVKSKDEKSSLL